MFKLQWQEFPCLVDPERYVQRAMIRIPTYCHQKDIFNCLWYESLHVPRSKMCWHMSVHQCHTVIVTHCCICVLLSHISCFSQISILISASLFSSHACFVRRCDCISAGVCAWHLQRCQEDTKRAKTDIIFDINNDNWQFNRALCALSAIKRFFFYWKSSCRVSILVNLSNTIVFLIKN